MYKAKPFQFLIPILIFLTMIIMINPYNDDIDANLNEFSDESYIKSADFWDLSATGIYIDDDNNDYNWSKTALENDWCSGSGTVYDPYIIRNVYIERTGNCIYISDSNVYFEIENCTCIANGIISAGIRLNNVNNSKLLRNNCSFAGHTGIWLEDCHKNIISENLASENYYNGILIRYSEHNTISDNKFVKNHYDGIYIFRENKENLVIRNNVSYNDEYGIIIEEDSLNNTISDNIIQNNTQIGLDITTTANGNLVLGNCFINNGMNARDNGQFNRWDNGRYGNFWDDYTGLDDDGNNIGDDPHSISGTAGTQDNFPVMVCGYKPPSGGAILGFDLVIIIGSLFVISIIAVRKRLKINL